MEDKFKFLNIISKILKILSWILLLAALVRLILRISRGFVGYIPGDGVYLIISFFALQAIARIADVVLEIEKNTRNKD